MQSKEINHFRYNINMKKLFLFGLIGGATGSISLILIIEAVTMDSISIGYLIAAIISLLPSIYVIRQLYKSYLNYTKESYNAIDRCNKSIY